MRNLLALLFAVCLMASYTFSQHTDVINQVGNENDAVVDQNFVGGGGALPGNEAYIDQIGNRNTSNVYQDNNGFAGTAQLADVYSDGDENIANVTQINDGFDGIITQLGNRNEAYIYQSGNKGNGTVLQTGNRNYGNMSVWGEDANAWIQQQGDDNTANQYMGQGAGLKVKNSYLEAKQFGNRNEATQTIIGQGFAGGVTSDNNEGRIYQDGDDNTGMQYIGVYNGNVANNLGVITQLGNNNNASQYLNGDGNTSTINQTGNQNEAVSYQN